jgi:hypothetical protein
MHLRTFGFFFRFLLRLACLTWQYGRKLCSAILANCWIKLCSVDLAHTHCFLPWSDTAYVLRRVSVKRTAILTSFFLPLKMVSAERAIDIERELKQYENYWPRNRFLDRFRLSNKWQKIVAGTCVIIVAVFVAVCLASNFWSRGTPECYDLAAPQHADVRDTKLEIISR